MTLNREVGIDIERIRPEIEYEQLAERNFSSREVQCLRALPPALRLRAFFDCWTRKEAFIKAKGKGLSIPLADFDVSFAPTEPARLLGVRWDAEEIHRWSLHGLPVDPEYAGAMAIEGDRWQLRSWQCLVER
jgi:4'-phosphopantetheinyl transferase